MICVYSYLFNSTQASRAVQNGPEAYTTVNSLETKNTTNQNLTAHNVHRILLLPLLLKEIYIIVLPLQ